MKVISLVAFVALLMAEQSSTVKQQKPHLAVKCGCLDRSQLCQKVIHLDRMQTSWLMDWQIHEIQKQHKTGLVRELAGKFATEVEELTWFLITWVELGHCSIPHPCSL